MTNLPLEVEVAWADITRLGDTDIVMSGAYMGMPPVGTLAACDAMISAGVRPKGALALLIGRGALRCAVGDVHFFPCQDNRQLLVLGMGRQGLFSRTQLVRAARCAAEAIGSLRERARVATVLVGTSAGNLEMKQSVEGILEGFVQAMQADRTLRFEHLRIVEARLDRAFAVVDALNDLPKSASYREHVSVARDLVEPEGGGGTISPRFGFSMMLGEVARACVEGPGNPLHASWEALRLALPSCAQDGVRDEFRTYAEEYARQKDRRRDGLRFRLGREHAPDRGSPDRVTFSQDGRQIKTAAMTNLATVTERPLAMKCSWIERIIDDLYDPRESPDLAPLAERCRNAYGSLIHPDIREKVAEASPLVIEVDRRLAGVPWEMLRENGPDHEPLGVRRPLARQLRTIYSPRVTVSAEPTARRALVIGDPDGKLDWAADEAAAVYKLLDGKRFAVDVCIRPANAIGKGTYKLKREGEDRGFVADPADLFRILQRLQRIRYDIVHYAGHAVFAPAAPEQSGWRFAEGEVLTAAMLENTESAPTLIFANACLSARVAKGRGNDSRLVASLADEFMRRGVADYVGTGWQIDDKLAQQFAVTFYTAALADAGKHIGAALQDARRELYEKGLGGDAVGAWAAYQHYGDPCRILPRAPASAVGKTTDGAAKP